MGNKSYFCDYCRCFMKNDKNVRKTHNDGLQHKIIKTSFMKKHEDPRKVYEEEINKQPCYRYFKGYCKYDLYCQFTHYNNVQLKKLQEIVKNLNTKSKQTLKLKKIFKHPWQTSIQKKTLRCLPTKMPQSLRPLNFTKFSKLDVSNNKWGC